MPGPNQDYTDFAFLIEEGHKKGLSGVTTELLDHAFDTNGNPVYAIVKSTAYFGDTKYEGIGDATRENTNRGIGPHLIRMASTRSISRALRVALGVGKTAVEELGGSGGGDETPAQQPTRQNQYRSESGGTATRGGAQAQGRQQGLAREKVSEILEVGTVIYGDEGTARREIENRTGKPIEQLSGGGADNLLRRLNAKAEEIADADAEGTEEAMQIAEETAEEMAEASF